MVIMSPGRVLFCDFGTRAPLSIPIVPWSGLEILFLRSQQASPKVMEFLIMGEVAHRSFQSGASSLVNRGRTRVPAKIARSRLTAAAYPA